MSDDFADDLLRTTLHRADMPRRTSPSPSLLSPAVGKVETSSLLIEVPRNTVQDGANDARACVNFWRISGYKMWD